MLAKWKDLEALTTSKFIDLEVRPMLIEMIASKQKEDPVIAERIRRLEIESEIDDLKDFGIDRRR